jgi:hypothetical protein
MSGQPFKCESRYVEATGQRQLMVGAECSKCHRVEWHAAQNGGWGHRIFKTKGWLLGSRRSTDVCPGCRNQKEKRPDLSPAQRRAAFCRIEGVPRAGEAQPKPEPPIMNTVMAEKLAPIAEAMSRKTKKPAPAGATSGLSTAGNARRSARRVFGANAVEGVHFQLIREPAGTWGYAPIVPSLLEPIMTPVTSSAAAPLPKAAAPRTPTTHDNRRIRDAMDEHYDEARQMYRGSFTDESVAQKLAVPRAWVQRVREDFYGPETNEAALRKGRELDEAIDLARQAKDRLIAMAVELEERSREAEKIERDLMSARSKL